MLELTNLQINIDRDLIKEADELFNSKGTTLTDVLTEIITIVLRQTLQKKDNFFQANNEKEVEKRLEMLQSITGIISSNTDDINSIRAERLTKKGVLE